MSAPAEELLDAQTGVPRPASRPLLDVEHANTCSVVVPDTDSDDDDDDDLFEESSSHCPDIHAEESTTERLFQPTNHRRSSHRNSNTSSTVFEESSNNCSSPYPEDSLTSRLFEDYPHFISAHRCSNTDSSLFEDPSGHCSETETEKAHLDGELKHRSPLNDSSHQCTTSVAFVQENPPAKCSDIDDEDSYFNKIFEPPLSHREDYSGVSRQYSHNSSVFEDSENCPQLEDSYLDKIFEPPESLRDDIRGYRRKRVNTSSSVYASPLTQTPEPNAINKFEESYFERLFERPKNQQTQSNTGGREYPQCYRHSLPPSLSQGAAESTMSHQLSEPNCVNAAEIDVDPNVSHRLLELVNALAQVGQEQQEHSGNDSEEEDAADIRSGCQINLAFEDTEPDLPFNPRYIDITKSDCDHLPWYFQDSEDDISHLIYPEEELSSKRPHSIAVPSELVSTLNENDDFLRSRPMRSTVGSSKRTQDFQVPERPVSAAEFSGHGPSVSTSKSGFARSSPVRATIGVPSRFKGSSRLLDEQVLNESDTPTILENPEFTRSNSTRSAVGVNSRSGDLDSYTPVYQTSGFAVGNSERRSHSESHYQQVPDTGDKRPLCQDVDEILDAAESGSVNQLFDERTFQQVPEFDHKVSERSAECSPAYVRNSRQLYESSHQVPEGDPEFSKSFAVHFRQVSEPNHQSSEGSSKLSSKHDYPLRHLSEPNPQTSEVDSDVVMPLDQHFRQVSEPHQHTTGRSQALYLRRASEPIHFAQSFDRVVPEPSAPSEEELDSPVLLRAAHLRAASTAGQPSTGSFVRASRQSSSMGHPRRESSGDGDGDGNRTSTESSDEIDWSWVAGEARRLEAAEAGVSRPSSWVRASMRRVQHFRLEEPRVRSAPPETLAPLPPLSAQVVPELETTGPTVVPTGGGRDFPRRYSASPLHRQVVASPESHRPHPRRRSRSISSSAARQTDGSGAGRRRSRSSSTCSTAQDRRRRGSYRPSSSSESSEDAPSPTPVPGGQIDSGAESDHATNRPCDGRSTMADEAHSPLGHWPHNLSSMLATLGCTLGLFNISRFAIFSVQFGANFIIQFIFLTLVLGFPLYTFHVSLGQLLAAGVMDMWRISPIFQGIGIALLVSQALIGIYSIVGVSWMFIYFRDSFITKQDRYRWAEPYELYREDSTVNVNGSWHLEETVPDYLNGVVLQRHSTNSSENTFGHLKFQVTFNLAVVWMIVFVSLSKGLRSYGKVVYVFSLFPVFGMLILCTKLLGLTPTDTSHQVFPETVWSEFFLNTKCWVAAATEVFFTWGLLGAAMMQISSHNRHKHLLQRDVTLVMILTLAILLLAAFLANTCMLLLANKQYTYVPSSFEHMNVYTFLKPEGTSMSPMYAKTPVRFMTHSTFIVGCRIILPDVNSNQESGYQVLRLATEVVPATFALLGADQVSPFWAVLFYFVLILFGIAQQLAIWHCVITGIMAINAVSLKSWETTITFFSCACGFILGLPMTTELGIFVVYFLDYTVGCAWWIMVLYLLEIVAVFVVRGRPYNGENVVSTLFNKGVGCLQVWAAPMLVFTWNVILPVALMVLCITVFKNGKFRELYNWHSAGYENWPLWAREVGCLLQLLPIIAIPLVGIVQSCRYLSDGPPDLFDRIQLLYRPPLENEESREQTRPNNTTSTTNANTGSSNVSATPAEAAFEDPPPKYTPPPSYTTATGARIAKLLRQSFRRSMRRITSVLGDNTDGFGSTSPRLRASLPPPPDYAAVLVEINQALQNRDQNNSEHSGNVAITITDVDPVRTNASAGNSGIVQSPNMRHLSDTRMSTLTAADVAHILRSSLRRTLQRSSVRGEGGREGNEQLVQGAAPINHDQHAKTEQDTSVI